MIYLLDRYGTVLTGLEHPMETNEQGMPERAIAGIDRLDKGSTTVDAKGRDGVDRFYAVTPMRAERLDSFSSACLRSEDDRLAAPEIFRSR